MTGRTAGPLRPPVRFARYGRFRSTSISIPSSVFATEMQSAPAASTASAISTMLPTFGESFTISGRLETARQARVTAAAEPASSAKRRPPSRIFGQEMFTSRPAIPDTPSNDPANSSKSATDSPEMLAITGTAQRSQIGALSRMMPRSPTFWSPIAFSIPAGVSAILGGGLPSRGRTVIPFEQIAPIRWMSTSGWYSVPYPNVPEATRTGFASSRPCMFSGPRLTARRGARPAPFSAPLCGPDSGMRALPDHLVGLEDRAVAADPLIPLARHHDAAEADPHRAAHVLLHRQLDRLVRADRAGHPERGRPRQTGHRFEHWGRAAGEHGIRPVDVAGQQLRDEAVMAERAVDCRDAVLDLWRELVGRKHVVGGRRADEQHDLAATPERLSCQSHQRRHAVATADHRQPPRRRVDRERAPERSQHVELRADRAVGDDLAALADRPHH